MSEFEQNIDSMGKNSSCTPSKLASLSIKILVLIQKQKRQQAITFRPS